MNHSNNRYDDSPDSWPQRASCGGGCGGATGRMGMTAMPQRWDESWQPDYVQRNPIVPRMATPRYFPDEQPDAVFPRVGGFPADGVQRSVSTRYDDSPDSPNFYAPRNPQMMQPPMVQRPWDDGPDLPNWYMPRNPQMMQPPVTQRPWDDSPDSPNFYAPRNPQMMQPPMVQRPWDDSPDSPNFYAQQSYQRMQPLATQRPWDDGPDTDNFCRNRNSNFPKGRVKREISWDDEPNTMHFYRRFYDKLLNPRILQVNNELFA